MKTTEKKAEFIALRVEGLSFSRIAERLHISKSTAAKWEKDFAEQIADGKAGRLSELYTLYNMSREARIKQLGETIKRIDQAIAKKDLSEIPADKLLRIRLEYAEKLQACYTEPTESTNAEFSEYSQREVTEAAAALYADIKSGRITPQQARPLIAALEEMQRAVNAELDNW